MNKQYKAQSAHFVQHLKIIWMLTYQVILGGGEEKEKDDHEFILVFIIYIYFLFEEFKQNTFF